MGGQAEASTGGTGVLSGDSSGGEEDMSGWRWAVELGQAWESSLPRLLDLQAGLSLPPLQECNLLKPLIKSILEVIKVSAKICSFSILSLKQNL